MNPILCGCGCAPKGHVVGTEGCQRRVVPSPIPAGTHPYLGPMWSVNGCVITDYTLRHQRGYYQHPDGTWTSHGDSFNSLDA